MVKKEVDLPNKLSFHKLGAYKIGQNLWKIATKLILIVDSPKNQIKSFCKYFARPINITNKTIGSKKYARHSPAPAHQFDPTNILTTEAAKNKLKNIPNHFFSVKNFLISNQSVLKYFINHTKNKTPNSNSSKVDGSGPILSLIKYVGKEIIKNPKAIFQLRQAKKKKKKR